MYFLFRGRWAYNWRATLKWGGGWGYKRLFSFMVFFSVLQNLTKPLGKAYKFYNELSLSIFLHAEAQFKNFNAF